MLQREPIIEINDLCFTYYGAAGEALHYINLAIGKGEFVGITGPTGVGKTTLSLCLNGVIPHTVAGDYRGEVRIKDQSVRDLSSQALSRWVGSVFQDPEAQLVSATVEEELAFGPENLATPREEIVKRIDFALEAVGISHLRQAGVTSLSGGQKQRVAIAAALTMLPQILVLDEPTSELDPMGTDSVFEVLKKLNMQLGVTIVIIEHKLEHLAKYCDRLLVMDQGEIKAAGAPAQIFARWREIQLLGVNPPQVTEFIGRLTERLPSDGTDLKRPAPAPTPEIPVTLDQARDFLSGLLKQDKLEFSQ